MTLTLLLLIFIFIAFFSALTIILVTVKKGEFSKRPYLQSIIVYILFFTNWILYLSTFYALLPEKISELLFLPIWFFLCILGFIAFWREWRNNRVFSICIGFLSFISFLFGLFFYFFRECDCYKEDKNLFITVFFVP
ncbi:hypothetical protein AB1I89_12035 [Bacillus pacificus]